MPDTFEVSDEVEHCARVCVCVRVLVGEPERERKRENIRSLMCENKRGQCTMCVFKRERVCVREREGVCVSVFVRERERHG